ncbi:hypothetical protein GGTG_07192 [Gaeumannomyces tritici R3-111a-1]|uniref:Uncharacterized protein n=1 Tax=Gaeumannomyces tritici (strain R3-111a-1) TaxID=644352 RepID=J3P0Z6_GAET3|nr:hypothetical protein GGTG_07192 [Gaeumannomyces tritici R3-111a-1]EJT77280.1 hypothetical protein GGTG_07192 [Gaeumannomyces tritici R3-111a-1]
MTLGAWVAATTWHPRLDRPTAPAPRRPGPWRYVRGGVEWALAGKHDAIWGRDNPPISEILTDGGAYRPRPQSRVRFEDDDDGGANGHMPGLWLTGLCRPFPEPPRSTQRALHLPRYKLSG